MQQKAWLSRLKADEFIKTTMSRCSSAILTTHKNIHPLFSFMCKLKHCHFALRSRNSIAGKMFSKNEKRQRKFIHKIVLLTRFWCAKYLWKFHKYYTDKLVNELRNSTRSQHLACSLLLDEEPENGIIWFNSRASVYSLLVYGQPKYYSERSKCERRKQSNVKLLVDWHLNVCIKIVRLLLGVTAEYSYSSLSNWLVVDVFIVSQSIASSAENRRERSHKSFQFSLSRTTSHKIVQTNKW